MSSLSNQDRAIKTTEPVKENTSAVFWAIKITELGLDIKFTNLFEGPQGFTQGSMWTALTCRLFRLGKRCLLHLL